MIQPQLACPFCGSGALYDGYHNVDGFEQPFMFCNSCKAMFTVEGSEDWVTEESDGMDELRAHWNNRPATPRPSPSGSGSTARTGRSRRGSDSRMANQGNVLPRVLCASCRHCTSRELVRGHRRRGWCEVGHAWVPLAKVRECLYWRPFGGDPQ